MEHRSWGRSPSGHLPLQQLGTPGTCLKGTLPFAPPSPSPPLSITSAIFFNFRCVGCHLKKTRNKGTSSSALAMMARCCYGNGQQPSYSWWTGSDCLQRVFQGAWGLARPKGMIQWEVSVCMCLCVCACVCVYADVYMCMWFWNRSGLSCYYSLRNESSKHEPSPVVYELTTQWTFQVALCFWGLHQRVFVIPLVEWL